MPGRTTFSNQVTTPIPPDVDPNAVIDLLHDHGFLITMSPIVTRHELQKSLSDSDKLTYKVWENINVLPLGLWKHEISFTTSFKDTKKGVVTSILAAMGFASEATLAVKPAQDDKSGWVLDEKIESACNVVLKWFIESTMVPVRQKMHAQICDAARARATKE